MTTKADLEQLSVVGPETTVHQAGEWEDDFPRPDTDAMSEFLETKSEDAGKDDENADGTPGFGIGAGLASIAGLLTTLVLRRRA